MALFRQDVFLWISLWRALVQRSYETKSMEMVQGGICSTLAQGGLSYQVPYGDFPLLIDQPEGSEASPWLLQVPEHRQTSPRFSLTMKSSRYCEQWNRYYYNVLSTYTFFLEPQLRQLALISLGKTDQS